MNDWKIEWSNGCCFGLQQLLANSIKIFISHEKQKWLVVARNLQSIITFLTLLNWVSISRVVAHFLKQAGSGLQWLPQSWKHPVFELAHPTSPSFARALPPVPQELGNWFCSQTWNLCLSSGIALRSDCYMIDRGLNYDSNLSSAAALQSSLTNRLLLTSAAWPTGWTGFICSKIFE